MTQTTSINSYVRERISEERMLFISLFAIVSYWNLTLATRQTHLDADIFLAWLIPGLLALEILIMAVFAKA